MKIALRHSGFLTRVLRSRHRWPIRLVTGVACAGFAALTTASPVLAAEAFRRIWNDNDFMLGLRRMSWYARRSWLGLDMSQDPLFVFCDDLDLPALHSMARFLERRQLATPQDLWLGDMAYVTAALAQAQAGTAGFPAAMRRFATACDALLAAMAEDPAVAGRRLGAVQRDPFSAAAAGRALHDVQDLLRAGGVEGFVLSGTFLGLVREGDFLPHDYDLDIGVMAEACAADELHALLTADGRFSAAKWEIMTSFERDARGEWHIQKRPVLLKLRHQDGIMVDIFLHYREEAVIWHGSRLYRWDNSPFDLIPYRLAGGTVMGPRDADRYLTENYGNWRVPVTSFHCAVDTPNLRLIRNPLSCAIFLRDAWVLQARDPEKAGHLLAHLAEHGVLRRQSADGWRLCLEAFPS